MCSHMYFQIAFSGESFTAYSAFEGAIPSVGTEMNLHSTSTREMLVAYRTLVVAVGFSGVFSRENSLKADTRRGGAEGSTKPLMIGHLYLIRLVSQHVLLHVTSGGKGFITDLTLEWPLFGVASVVYF